MAPPTLPSTNMGSPQSPSPTPAANTSQHLANGVIAEIVAGSIIGLLILIAGITIAVLCIKKRNARMRAMRGARAVTDGGNEEKKDWSPRYAEFEHREVAFGKKKGEVGDVRVGEV